MTIRNPLRHVAALLLAACTALAAHAAIDVNKASQAELEALRGVGPAMAGRMLDARKSSEFKSWDDLIERVRGIGAANATKLSEAGLTVAGASFKGSAAPQPAAKAPRRAKATDPAAR